MICCTGFALVGVYPFGDRSALVIDGVHQYIGMYEELLRQIKQGWSFAFSDHAMGYSFYNLFSYYLSSPFSLLILFLMQFIYVNEAVTIAILVKIGLTGTFMTWYVLRKIPSHTITAVCIGSMYALSNFVLGYYSNLMWLDCVMLLPVLAWSLEELIYFGRWKKYSFILGYCIISNYYMGFIICIFSVLYYTAETYGAEERAEVWWKSGLKYAGASVLGGGLAAIILVPAVFAVSKTTAARQAGLLITGGTYGDIWEQLGRLLFDSYPYATSGNQASVNLYCGCAVLLFYLAGFHFQTLNLLLHGLHKPVGMPNRFAFVFVFLLLKAAAEGWGKVGEINRRQLAQGIGISVLFCFFIGSRMGNVKTASSMSLLILYGMLLAMVLGFYRKKYVQKENVLSWMYEMLKGESQWRIILGGLILCEISVHAVLSICNTGSANRNVYVDSGREIRRMLKEKEQEDPGQTYVYRTDIVNPVLRNEELLYGLNGILMFSSTNTDEMAAWMEKMGFETGKNRFQYSGLAEVMDMLLGIRFLAYRNGLQMDTCYQKITDGVYFDLYKNPRALSGGYLVDEGVKDSHLEGDNPLEIQNKLLNKMGCGPLYTVENVNAPSVRSGESGSLFEINLKGGEHGYLCIAGPEPSEVNVGGRIQQSDGWNNNFLDLGYSDTDRTVPVAVPSHVETAVLGTYEKSRLDTIYRQLS